MTPFPYFTDFDRVIVAFSGGKDSLACLLRLLDEGCPKDRMELWHHDVDGREGSDLMDWPITRDYCRAVAAELGLPLYFSWRVGGIEREMLRNGTATAPVSFESPLTQHDREKGVKARVHTVGGDGPTHDKTGKPYVREKFPQVSANLSVRWCSAVVKIDVAARVFSNDPRFKTGRFLFVTGERREESSARAKYLETEPGRANTKKRVVVQWRAVIDYTEADVWALIQRHGIRPHPAYELGFGRVSCQACIFGNPDQWAAVRELAPERFEKIAQYEERFGVTIQRKESVRQQAAKGTSLVAGADPNLVQLGRAKVYGETVQIGKAWTMPAGAFKECGGPT